MVVMVNAQGQVTHYLKRRQWVDNSPATLTLAEMRKRFPESIPLSSLFKGIVRR